MFFLVMLVKYLNGKNKLIIKHKHLIVRAEIIQPPKEYVLRIWVIDLIKKIGMTLLKGPISSYVDDPGNKGATCLASIKTSHIAVHIWDEDSPALMQLDVYSCADFDIKDVFSHIEQFIPVKLEYKFLDREEKLHLLEKSK